jgi:hypothetical protein
MITFDQRTYPVNPSRANQKEVPQGPPGEVRIHPIPDRHPESVREIDGPPGPEPTRYGDWEKNGRCIDF